MSKDGSEKTEPAKRQRQTGVVVGMHADDNQNIQSGKTD